MNTNRETSWAAIIDNRDGAIERVAATCASVWEARQMAYASAADECESRNSREGWARFVAVPWRAGHRLGFFGTRANGIGTRTRTA